jgi:hypothetical protein
MLGGRSANCPDRDELTRLWYNAGYTYLFEGFSDVVKIVNNAVIVHSVVSSNGVVATAGSEEEVDELGLSRPRRLLKGLKKVFDSRL